MKDGFYNVHIYQNYVAFWLQDEMDDQCIVQDSDFATYFSELDDGWNNDVDAAVWAPEALLFTNLVAQMACAADCTLRRLPEPSLVAQFGDAGRQALAWATGRRIDPVRPWHRPRPIRVSLDFPVPVGLTETLHGALDRAEILLKGLGGEGARSLLLISDGDFDEADLLPRIKKLAEEQSIRFHALGVGTTDGAPVPGPRGGPKRRLVSPPLSSWIL